MFFQWSWHYCLPNLGIWALAIILLVLLRGRLGRRAWPTVILAVLTVVLWQMEGFSVLFGSLAAIWAVVWLVGSWTSQRRPAADDLAAALSGRTD